MGFTIQTHIRSHSSGKSPCLIGKSSVGSIAMLDHQRENLPRFSSTFSAHGLTYSWYHPSNPSANPTFDPQSCDAGGQATATFGPSQSWWKIYGEPRFFDSQTEGVVDCKCSLQMDFSENRVLLMTLHCHVPMKNPFGEILFFDKPKSKIQQQNQLSHLVLKRNGCCTEECSRDIPTEDV